MFLPQLPSLKNKHSLHTLRRAKALLGTVVEIVLITDDTNESLEEAMKEAFFAIALAEKCMNFYSPTSDIGRLNQTNEYIEIHDWTLSVLHHGEMYREATNGLFSIAANHDQPTPPIFFDSKNKKVQRLTNSKINLGGIAKGFAVDKAIEVLISYGIKKALINAGGDLRAIGEDAFTVHIRSPHELQSYAHCFDLKSSALATSCPTTTYQKKGGILTSDLIHPITQKFITQPISISVQASDCMTADAMTKVFFLADGPKQDFLIQEYQLNVFQFDGKEFLCLQ